MPSGPDRAGDYRRLMTLMRQSSTDFDTLGQSIEVPVEVGEWWAKLEPLAADEAVYVEHLEMTTTHRITVRYSTTIDAMYANRMWWEWNGRRFDIASILDVDGHTRRIEMTCGERR